MDNNPAYTSSSYTSILHCNMKSSMSVLPSNDEKLVHAAGSIRPKDFVIDFLAPSRKSAFTPYRAKQGTTMPQDSPKKTKSLCVGHDKDDEDDDDDYAAYMLRMERQAYQKELAKQVIEPESMKTATFKRAHWSASEDNEDYELAKQVIETKTKMKKPTFKGAHSSSELAKQVIEPKPKMNKTSSKSSHSPTEEIEDYGLAKEDIEPKTKKNKVTSKRSRSPTMVDEDYELANKVVEPKAKKNKATSSKRSRSPNEDDDEDYEIAKKMTEPKTKKNKATSSKRSHSSTEDDDDNGNDKEIKKLKRKIQKEIEREMNNKPPITNEVTKRLKEFITSDEINGTDITLVIQKLLYVSDLRPSQNRLTMPINQLKTLEFLTPQEKELLDDKNSKGFDVQLVGPKLQIYKEPMNLARWKMETTQSYVLKTHWNHFVEDHQEDLIENSIIQVWSFRKDNKLCFALAIVERAKPMLFENQDSPSSS